MVRIGRRLERRLQDIRVRTNWRKHRKTIARERFLDWLVIEMADRAGAFGIRIVMVPDVAQRGRDDEKAHEG